MFTLRGRELHKLYTPEEGGPCCHFSILPTTEDKAFGESLARYKCKPKGAQPRRAWFPRVAVYSLPGSPSLPISAQIVGSSTCMKQTLLSDPREMKGSRASQGTRLLCGASAAAWEAASRTTSWNQRTKGQRGGC